MEAEQQKPDGKQNGPGEQIRPRADEENRNLDNLRGGADPSGGQSSEVPRDNSKANPAASGEENVKQRDITPLSTPSDGSASARPTEDDLAKQQAKGGDQ